MEEDEILKEITKKKEFSRLPERDVALAFEKFERRQVSDEEKARLTRETLHKVYSSFTSQKLLSPKNKPYEWFLKKHRSTKERLPYYKEIYGKIFSPFDLKKEISIIDLGAGVNGFGYNFLKEAGIKAKYRGIEAIGQMVDITNNYFKKEKINGQAFHYSLFETEKIKDLIKNTKKPRVIFLFKVIDSLEIIKRDYSKLLLKEIAPFADLIVVSFAVESMIKRRKFKANRKWIIDFIQNNFKITDDFEYGGERYICFAKR
ncbi:MAG: hypothetical protein AABY15_01035 [Nanoarchaeota archaeon]